MTESNERLISFVHYIHLARDNDETQQRSDPTDVNILFIIRSLSWLVNDIVYY